MVQVACNGDGADQVRLLAQLRKELKVVAGCQRVGLVKLEIGFFGRRDNGRSQGLRVFLHHERLDALAENLLRIRIVLLVLVQDDLVPMRVVLFFFGLLVELHKLVGRGHSGTWRVLLPHRDTYGLRWVTCLALVQLTSPSSFSKW